MSAIDEIEGVISDIEAGQANAVCVNTLRRVAAEIERLRTDRDELEAIGLQAATLAQRLQAALDNIVNHSMFSSKDKIVEYARAAIASPEGGSAIPSRPGGGGSDNGLARWRGLGRAIIECDPDDAAADAVTALDVWRKEAADLLAMTD